MGLGGWECVWGGLVSFFLFFLKPPVLFWEMPISLISQSDSPVWSASALSADGIESKHTCHALPSLQLIIHNQHQNTPLPPVRKHRPPEQNRRSKRQAPPQHKENIFQKNQGGRGRGEDEEEKKKNDPTAEIINISLVLFGGITHNHRYLLMCEACGDTALR